MPLMSYQEANAPPIETKFHIDVRSLYNIL